MMDEPGPACPEYCAEHQRLCERPPGHDGPHECDDHPAQRARRHHETIAARVASYKALDAAGFNTTPDED